MGKALYREYRPKKLEDVVGQKHITDTLRNAVNKKAIAHAYLFTGPRGVGKTSIARILAHEINGLEYNEEATHLDIIEIDAASNRKIDEIRDLRDKVHIAPTSAKYKVYIIDEVHMLTREAFNALLKTLEEPPAHVVFILATTEAHKVPDTIISRTQRFSFKPIEHTDATEHLRIIADQEKITITDEALALLAKHGRGSFRDSISMLDQLTGLNETEITAQMLQELLGIPNNALLESMLQAVEQQDVTKLFETIATLRTQGAHPSVIAQNFIILLRDTLIAESSTLPNALTIRLMKDLLPLTATAASYEALEIVLLDASTEKTATAVAQTNTAQRSLAEKKPTTPPEQTKSIHAQEIPTKAKALLERTDIVTAEAVQQAEPAVAPTNDWNGVLDALKGHHNTLYGVLRMAKADLTDNELVLCFQFAFHQKQAAQTKHVAILRETAEKVLGKPIEISMSVDSSQSSLEPARATETKKPKIDLQNVSNIFGGAELLES